MAYKRGMQRIPEALRDGAVKVPNATTGMHVEAGPSVPITVVYNQKVTDISFLDGVGSSGNAGARVRTDSGETFAADKVIVAVPLGVLKMGSIAFSPPLPPSKLASIGRAGVGNLNKVVLQYTDMFWPEQDQTFNVVRAGHYARGFLTHWVNMYPVTGEFMLVGYATGEAADVFELLGDADLLQAANTMLAVLFPTATIPEPAAFERSAWRADPLAGGAYAYSAVGTTPLDWGVLSVPVGGWLWFTGEHLAHGMRLQGTMRGAFEVGRMVAFEMLIAREKLGLGFHLEFEFGAAATNNYQPILRRYSCEDSADWVDPNGNGCPWYLDMGCPGRHMEGQRKEYHGGSDPAKAQVYGDYGQFLNCPVACTSCVDRKCHEFPCDNDGLCFDGRGAPPRTQTQDATPCVLYELVC